MEKPAVVGGAPPDRVKDPVCGMSVVPGAAKGGSSTYEGRTFHFCNPKCREKFEAEPAHYLGEQSVGAPPQPGHSAAVDGSAPAAPPTGTRAGPIVYVCPMHPEVRQSAPGACPKCGMALEPERVTAFDAPNPELVDMTRRFWL